MPTATLRKTKRDVRARKSPKKLKRISYTHRPRDMQLREWQLALRHQVAGDQRMRIRNLGTEPVFSEFSVTNPATRKTYRVVIRGQETGLNFCSCPDYAVNTLGTCKHIEATLHKLRRGHAKTLGRGYRPPFSEVFLRYGIERKVTFAAGTDCPEKLANLARRHFGTQGILKSDSFSKFNTFMRSAARIDHDLKIYDDALALIAEVRDGKARRTRLQRRYRGSGSPGAPGTRWRKLLKVGLFRYQREGALFAAQAGRAIIADEMGLGKTIEAIAAAELLAREGDLQRVLIVCPASLKSQWHAEIERFSMRAALILEGQTHQRKALYERDDAFFKIVNYDVIHRDLEPIAAWGPDLVILDEAQRIKNWQTRTAKSVKQIESSYAMVLTGTPLENRLEELHSIVEFVDRHRLGPLFAFKATHEICEKDSSKVVGYRDLNRISKTLAPILIRRTKKEVLKQLPPRMDKNFFLPMTDQQWVPHRENQEIVARLVHKWRKHKFLTEKDQLRLRIALQYMRMACDSTYLIDHETKHGTKVDELCTLLAEIFEDSSSKVVIFSQWVRMNELVAEMLDDRRWGHVHLYGGVPSRKRKNLTKAFREQGDCRVFLSTDAGGVGLNLQSAATVISMDLPWNPAVLEQRIGRVHRIGQKRPVRVVNFISEGTIEHGMLSLLSFKKSLFSGVLDGTANQVFMGDSALNRFMKTVETATSSVPPITPTPVDEVASQGAAGFSPREQTRGQVGESVRDEQTLGALLNQGATLLQTLSEALTTPTAKSDNGDRQIGHPRIANDPTSGRPELRITLPDDATLQKWTQKLGELFAALQIRS